MEIKNKLTVARGVGEGIMGERREGSSPGTCTKDPWTKTMGWGGIEGGRWEVGKAEESNGGKWGQL